MHSKVNNEQFVIILLLDYNPTLQRNKDYMTSKVHKSLAKLTDYDACVYTELVVLK